MSYCRFSSMNFMCDVYVYEDVYGGWTTHVASMKPVFPPIPDVPHWLYINFGQKWDAATRSVKYPSATKKLLGRAWYWLISQYSSLRYWMLAHIKRVPIGLPHDGGHFNHATPGDCAAFLIRLRGMGYRVPQFAIDSLLSEAAA